MLQTSVDMVNPGGTGKPALVISASPEPLPPSKSFMWRLPSALPPPKKYTCFRPLGFGTRDLGFAGRAVLALRFAVARLAISFVSVGTFAWEPRRKCHRFLKCACSDRRAAPAARV